MRVAAVFRQVYALSLLLLIVSSASAFGERAMGAATGAPAVKIYDVLHQIIRGTDPESGRRGILGACTGSIVEVNGEKFYLTAAHCLEGSVFQLRFGIEMLHPGFVPQRTPDVEANRIAFTRMHFNDLGIMPWPANVRIPSSTRVHTLRTTPLERDETVYVLGYGGSVGPQKVACRFKGRGIVDSVNVRFSTVGKVFVPASGLVCDRPNSVSEAVETSEIKGFSGGPVLDSGDRLVGVISSTSKGRANNTMEIFYTELINHRLVTVDGRKFLTPRERIYEARYVDMPGYLMAAVLETGDSVLQTTSTVCYDSQGFPQALSFSKGARQTAMLLVTSSNPRFTERAPEFIQIGAIASSTHVIGGAPENDQLKLIEDQWTRVCGRAPFAGGHPNNR